MSVCPKINISGWSFRESADETSGRRRGKGLRQVTAEARNFQAEGPDADCTLKSCKRTQSFRRQRSNGGNAGISQAKKRRKIDWLFTVFKMWFQSVFLLKAPSPLIFLTGRKRTRLKEIKGGYENWILSSFVQLYCCQCDFSSYKYSLFTRSLVVYLGFLFLGNRFSYPFCQNPYICGKIWWKIQRQNDRKGNGKDEKISMI